MVSAGVDVTIKSQDVDKLVASIQRTASASALDREFSSALGRTAKPIREAMKAQVPSALPRRGGLAAQMQARLSMTTARRSGGLSLRFGSSGYSIRTLTGGHIRHPVWGNRAAWVDQTAGANPEAFAGAFEKQRPVALREVSRAMAEIARKVTNI